MESAPTLRAPRNTLYPVHYLGTIVLSAEFENRRHAGHVLGKGSHLGIQTIRKSSGLLPSPAADLQRRIVSVQDRHLLPLATSGTTQTQPLQFLSQTENQYKTLASPGRVRSPASTPKPSTPRAGIPAHAHCSIALSVLLILLD